MARETRYRVLYFDEKDKRGLYNENFHTFHDMLLEGVACSAPEHQAD